MWERLAPVLGQLDPDVGGVRENVRLRHEPDQVEMYFSGELRAYSLMVLCVTCALALEVADMDRAPSKRAEAALAGIFVLGLYSHYMFLWPWGVLCAARMLAEGFALSHSTMRARGTREDPSAVHVRSLAVEPHDIVRGDCLWTGVTPSNLRAG